MALDLGTRRVGVAVCDPGELIAFPHGVIDRSPDAAADRRRLADLADELEAEAVIVGLPLTLGGVRGAAAMAAEAEAAALAEVLGVPLECHDERMSTVTAHRQMNAAGRNSRERRGSVDAAAAAVILQSWLDSRRLAGDRDETSR
ncbi:MAG: Holliday junction resolvase RuvX [Acidimicrobiales bacterium]